MRVGVIGGGGWLGGAIVDALIDAGTIAEADLVLSYRSAKPDRLPGAVWTTDSQAVADRSDVIFLSVRPQDWPAVDVDASGKLVVSVMAGVPIADIRVRSGSDRVVRSMPNAAAAVRRSYTPWVATPEITAEDRSAVRAIFTACGVEDEVSEERHLDYLTGLSGSGPAFPALLAAAMTEHAVSFGLPRAVAERAARTVIEGAGRLLEKEGGKPFEMVEAFVTYRGTTAAAIEAMRDGGFDDTVGSGLVAAFEKARSLAPKGA